MFVEENFKMTVIYFPLQTILDFQDWASFLDKKVTIFHVIVIPTSNTRSKEGNAWPKFFTIELRFLLAIWQKIYFHITILQEIFTQNCSEGQPLDHFSFVDFEANFLNRPSMASPVLKGLVKDYFCEDLTTRGNEFQECVWKFLWNYKEFYYNFCNSICRKENRNSFFHKRK